MFSQIKKDRKLSRDNIKQNRYLFFYIFWLSLSLILNYSVNTLLVKDKALLETILLGVLVLLCLPIYNFIDDLFFKHLKWSYRKMMLFAVFYMSVGPIIINNWIYSITSSFKYHKPYFPVLGHEITDVLLSQITIIYIFDIIILLFGIFPIFIRAKAKLHDSRNHFSIDYFKRLIPMMKTILMQKFKIVIGALSNLTLIGFNLILIWNNASNGSLLESPSKVAITSSTMEYVQHTRWVFVILTAWLSSLAAWLLPFITGLTSKFEETVSNTYRRKLRSTITSLQNHLIVVGYGDLGKKALNEIRRITFGKEQSTHILTPNTNLDFVTLRTDLVIIDKEEKAFRFIDSSMIA